MPSKVIKSIEGKFAGKSFQSLLQIRGKFGSVPSQQLYKKEVLRAVANSDPNMRKAIYGGSFVTHEAGKTFTKALQHVHGGEGKLELTEKAKRMLGLRKGQEIKGEKAQMVAKKLVTYFRKEAADAAPKSDEKDPAQIRREKRVADARRGMNLYQMQKERAEIESGKKTITPTSITSGQAQKSATSATSHEGAGTIAGATKYAGSDAAKPSVPIPGQHAAAPVASRGSVQLAGGIGLSRIEGKPADRADDIAIPHIVGASDVRGSAPSQASTDEGSHVESPIPTPGLRDPDAVGEPKKDEVDTPPAKNIDEGLPLLD